MTTATGSGMFIRVEADESVAVKQFVGICPVDIFADHDGKVAIVDDNLDECILCLAVGPKGAVRVLKLYDGEALLEAS